MKHSWSGRHDNPANAWRDSPVRERFNGPAVLVVEDGDDIRELLVTLLELAGYMVTPCSTAERGLEMLRQETFDFVLTDYALPRRSGGWLLNQAQSEGLLDATPAIVVTAHPNPPDIHGFEIIQKPFDPDDLVAQVRRRLSGASGQRCSVSGARRSSSGRPGDDGRGDCPGVVELILYVSAESPHCASAISNIRNVLSRYRAGKVMLTICELSKNPTMGAEDSIALMPTLVTRSPGPRTFILGHISNPDVLVELLEECEIES
jgi:CheY-like chemotaxis protein